MAQQEIGIGAAANDGSGDDLRAAGQKINENFTELYLLAEANAYPALSGNGSKVLTAKADESGVEWIAPASGGGGGGYSVPFGFTGPPEASEVLLIHVFAEAVTFADDFAGAQKYVGVNPTASYALSVARNGSTIGSIIVAADGTATFATTGSGDEAFAVGDVMTITGAVTADDTFANCAFTLKGVRS